MSMSGKQIDSMSRTQLQENSIIHQREISSSSPVQVKQLSPDSFSQCSSHSSSSSIQVKQLSPDSFSQCSSHSSSSSQSLPITIPLEDQFDYSFSRQASDPGIAQFHSPPEEHSPSSDQQQKGSSEECLVPTNELPIMATEVVSITTEHNSGPGCSEISELLSSHPNNSALLQHTTKPLILQHPSHTIDEGYINWLCELYPSVLSSPSAKEKLISSYQDTLTAGGPSISSHSPTLSSHIPSKIYSNEQVDTVFSSQEKYVVTLGAPISIAQRMGEDTLTYLNKGQFYSLFCKANSSSTAPEVVKSVVYLTFFDEPDSRVELNNWQYWYSLQANPNQKAFDIDRKSCEHIQGKPIDLAYNVTSFIWRPKLGAKLVLRINCLSTEFSSQKGVKGYPLHVVVDTYEDLENEAVEPVHRAYCKVKIFRDKGAERKNKDETKNLDRRIQKVMRQQPGVSLDSDIQTSVFHTPTRETVLTSTSTFGPKPFLFVPDQEGSPAPCFPLNNQDTTSLLANIKERETKRTISNILSQAKDDLNQLEVGAPAKKAALVPDRPMITVYVRKEEATVYNALLLDSLTVHDFKLQIAKTYDIPPEMIKNVFKKTKKGLLVNFSPDMISRFQDEDDFIIYLPFDNQKGCFDLHVRY